MHGQESGRSLFLDPGVGSGAAFDSRPGFRRNPLPQSASETEAAAQFTIIAIIAAMVAAMVAAIGIPTVRERLPISRDTTLLPTSSQLAILPFVNIGNDAANQSFCDGLVETLTSKLTQLEPYEKSFRIVPSSE